MTNQTTTDTTTITFTLNGKPATAPTGQTITDFLAGRGFGASMVVVEQNGVIVDRKAYGTTTLNEGDVVEMVHAVGGG